MDISVRSLIAANPFPLLLFNSILVRIAAEEKSYSLTFTRGVSYAE